MIKGSLHQPKRGKMDFLLGFYHGNFKSLILLTVLCLWNCAGVEEQDILNFDMSLETGTSGIESGISGMNAGIDQSHMTMAGMTAGMTTAGMTTAGMTTAGESEAGTQIDCGELTLCGSICVDESNDPQNCGGCGRTCVIPNASASCVDGQCLLNECQRSYFDVDQDLSNGCEAFNDCVAGESCMSSCGSEGVSECVNAQSQCIPPAETCNLQDDDCDGSCDEDWQALNCRVGIHRGYGQGEHIYSNELNVVSNSTHRLEFENYFYLAAETLPNSRPVFYCKTSANKPFLSTQTDCGINRAPLRNLGFWLASPECGASPLYHLKLSDDRDFFYTTSANERDHAVGLGYQDQGVVGYIWLP